MYANDGVVVSWDLEWIQGALNVLVSLFRRYGLVSNAVNSKAMICQPCTLQYRMSEEAVG